MLKVKILQVKMSHKFHPPHRLTGFWVFVCSRRIQQYHLRPWYGMLILMQTWWHFLATGTLFEKSYVPVEDSSLLCAQVCSLPNRYLRVDVIPKSHACHKTFLCPVVSSHVVATHCDFGAPTHYSSFAVCNGKASKKTGKRRRQLPNQSQEADQINTHRKTSHDQSQLSRNASQQIETGNRRTNAWEKPSMLQMPLKLWSQVQRVADACLLSLDHRSFERPPACNQCAWIGSHWLAAGFGHVVMNRFAIKTGGSFPLQPTWCLNRKYNDCWPECVFKTQMPSQIIAILEVWHFRMRGHTYRATKYSQWPSNHPWRRTILMMVLLRLRVEAGLSQMGSGVQGKVSSWEADQKYWAFSAFVCIFCWVKLV